MRIKSISEAYSMQPISFVLTTQETHDANKAWNDGKQDVKKIELEPVNIGHPFNSEMFMAYIGYGFDNQKLFTYKADSVNVQYEY
jgi:hypothetical protein